MSTPRARVLASCTRIHVGFRTAAVCCGALILAAGPQLLGTLSAQAAVNPPVITSPADGSSSTKTSPVFQGTGTPSNHIVVSEGSTVLCQTDVTSNGNWTCLAYKAMPPGKHTVTATASSGASSAVSKAVTFTQSGVPPVSPVILVPAADTVLSDTTPTFSGTGAEGATITVTRFASSGASTTLCTTEVTSGGTWSCAPGTPLAAGEIAVGVMQATPSGSVWTSLRQFQITLPGSSSPPVVTTKPPATTGSSGSASAPAKNPSSSGNTTTGSSGASTTTKPGSSAAKPPTTSTTSGTTSSGTTSAAKTSSGTVSSQTTSSGGGAVDAALGSQTVPDASTTSNAPQIVYQPVNGAMNTATPTFSGTGAAGQSVQLLEGTTSVCTTVVQADGSWSCTVSTPLADGVHTITAVQTDSAGIASDPSAALSFAIDTVPPAAPVITVPQDGSVLASSSALIQGTGEAGSRVFVSNGDGYVCAVTVGVDGHWSCTPQQPAAGTGEYTTALGPLEFTDGTHTLTAFAVDLAYNQSKSVSVTFTVDTMAPGTPTITGPADGSTTQLPKPTIKGTGESGALVTVVEGGTLLCQVTVPTSGAWMCVPTEALDPGLYAVTAAQTDPDGNASAPSDPVSFMVLRADGTAPALVDVGTSTGGTVSPFVWTGAVLVLVVAAGAGALAVRRRWFAR